MPQWLSWHPNLYGGNFSREVAEVEQAHQKQEVQSQEGGSADGSRPRRRSFGSYEPSTYVSLPDMNGQVSVGSVR
jgi:hypothetical protein